MSIKVTIVYNSQCTLVTSVCTADTSVHWWQQCTLASPVYTGGNSAH